MKKNKRKKSLFNEMLDSGALAAGMGEFGEAEDDFGGPDDDLGGLDDDLDLDDDLGGLDDELGDDLGGEEETVTCTKSELRDALERLEMGECSVDECMDELCAGDDLEGGLGDDLGDPGDLDDDMAGLEDDVDLDDDPFDECAGGMYESIARIAGMLTDDPDIIAENKACPECKKAQIPPSVSMCRKCDQRLKTPPPPTGGPKKKKKKLEDPDNPPQYKD